MMNLAKSSRSACVVALACWVVPLAASEGADGTKPLEKVFVGYLYGAPRDIKFSLYTHLCHAFATSDAEGNLRRSPGVPDRPLAVKAHEAGVKMLISLGGWGFDKQFASIVSKPEFEDRYVKAVLELVDEADYDGIDLDWEYPDAQEEVPGFERLCRRLRGGIDAIGVKKGRGMVLTMAASSNQGTLSWLARDFLLATMDWINVMTYDYTGEWADYAGHQSPLFGSAKQPGKVRRSTEATMRYLLEERKIPADRLAVGIPLYGRGFGVAEPYATTKGLPKGKTTNWNYSKIHPLLTDPAWTRRWDDETKNPWLIATDGSQVIGYDDAESVALKADWSSKGGFRGVFFWQINGDRLPDGSNPLQEAASRAFFGPAGRPGSR